MDCKGSAKKLSVRGGGGASVLRKLIGVGHCQARKSIKAPIYIIHVWGRVDKSHKFDGGALPIILMMAGPFAAS